MPYRLQTLREVIRESGREIKDPTNTDVSLSGGDIVEVKGTVEPMSFFRFELAEDIILTVNDAVQELVDTAQKVSEDDSNNVDVDLQSNIDNSTDTRINESFVRISEILNNDRVPIKLTSDNDNTFGALLDRDEILVPESHAFSHPRRYRLFDRIDYIVSMNSKWELTDTLRLARHYTTTEGEIDEVSEVLRTVANQHDLKMEKDHMRIEGPTKVIHPIAMYW